MRRMVILLLLLGLMQLLRPLGAAGYGSEALLTFGFLILAAYTVGEIAKQLHAPKIIGYLFAGVIFGPEALGVLSSQALTRLSPISELAIALIAFLAGAELRWSDIREHGTGYLKVMGTELTLSFFAIGTVLYAVSMFIPFLGNTSTLELVVFCGLFASVAIVHSPAVTMALLTETQAKGNVARTTLGVVLLADLAVVLLFSATLAAARALVPPSAAAPAITLAAVSWEIFGAILVGALLGGAVTVYLRFIGQDLFLFALLVAFLGAEVARLTHVETLLTLLTAGFVAENFSQSGQGDALRHAMERSAAPVFVIFFALAGAKIDVAGLGTVLFIVVPVAIARALGIFTGTKLGGRWAGVEPEARRYVWMGLISQAGVAIGLATIVASAYPERGEELRTLLLALIAVNETVGALLFRRALLASGEAVIDRAGELAPAPARPG
jgi:Kef-type K+ transport system membrane component KefB